MTGLEIVVLIGVVVLVGGLLANRLRIAAPLVLLLLGAGLGFVPGLGGVRLPPDVVLLLFLPALLYWDALNSSLREMRKHLRSIALAAIVLVLVTAFGVGAIASAFGLPWAAALALGAIVAPTDATAVGSMGGGLPRRFATRLRAESLINDGAALVLYGVAVGAAVSGSGIRLGPLALEFLISYLGAAAIGLAVGLLALRVRRYLREAQLLNALSLLTPFLAFLPAELAHVSGVVAVVASGLVVAYGGPRVIPARARRQVFGFWQVASYVLNATLFVLIGLQLAPILRALDAATLPLTAWLAGAVVLAMLGIRLAWFAGSAVVARLAGRGTVPLRIALRRSVPIGWAGFRGAVSLAAALALPFMTADGAELPYRDVLIGVTFAVIAFTLLVQGAVMPAIARWAALPPETAEDYEESLANRVATEAALQALPQLAEDTGTPGEIRDALADDYRARLEALRGSMDDEQRTVTGRAQTVLDPGQGLRRAAIAVKRRAVLDLRRRGTIDDDAFRRVQGHLDAEEIRLDDDIDDED